MALAGRGWGKTRVGAEWIREGVEAGKVLRVALVGRTSADVRDTMIEGESGLLSVCPQKWKPRYEPSKRRVTWPRHPRTGVSAIATAFSGDKPAQLRGPQHDRAWADELAAWRYPEAWAQLQFGLRLGANPQAIVTTTPRPTALIRELLADPGTFVTRGTTEDNRANLAPRFWDIIHRKYGGTRLGRQELNAELLGDNPLALWQRSQFEKEGFRITPASLPDFERIVVAVDPSVHDGKEDPETTELAECGIIVAGLHCVNDVPRGVILEDGTVWGSPLEWAAQAVALYHKWSADRIVAEVNNGGALVETVIRTLDRNVSYRAVHASRGKFTRAEPVSSLYEQGRIRHLGCFAGLEDELADWTPGQKSPNRLDALVWGVTDLAIDTLGGVSVIELGR